MCGIAGYTGFDPDMILIKGLGILNDERGGDSVGIYMDYELHKGILKNSEFKDLAKELSNTSSSPVLLHTRKSSSGDKSLSNVHPFEFNEKGELEKGGRYIGVHNGTVYNWRNLKTKYSLHGDMDSKVLLSAFVTEKYEALKEYEGGATLVLYDTVEFTFKIWKGATHNVEERPLYYVQENSGFYFSSLYDHLAVYFDLADIEDFDTNTIYTIQENKILETKKINRVGFIMEVIMTTGNTSINNLLQYCQNGAPLEGNYKKIKNNWLKSKTGTIFINGYKRNLAAFNNMTPYTLSRGFEGPIKVKKTFYNAGKMLTGIYENKDFNIKIHIEEGYAKKYIPQLKTTKNTTDEQIDLLWQIRKNTLLQLGVTLN